LKRFKPIATLAVFMLACGPGGEGNSRQVLQNKGSDTLVNVAQAWAEAYVQVDPSVAVAVSGGGSGTGISSMINGTVDIANSSRQMRDSEIEAARERGHDPIEFIVGYDALAVYLHPDNPIDGMTLAQLASIYGENGPVDNWSQLGITVPGCTSGEIVRVSRQNNSGTYAYFREAVLGEAEYKLGSRDMHGSKDVVDLVEHTPCAIGYSGLAYATEHVKMPCVMLEEGSDCVAPSVDSAIDGSYPIARPLYMYTSGQPEGAVKEYMDWILSQAGQCILLEKGYAPSQTVNCG
jgi:phosphate transport system substrate-binding protein